jgi:transcriptional regulator with XRE-family HTH domain
MAIVKRTFLTDTFVQRLQLAMMNRQVNASELARRAGVTPTAVWNWQQGNTTPRPQALSAIAKALSVSEDYLLEGPKQEGNRSPDEEQTLSINGETVAEMIEDLRMRIARVTGFALDRVKLSLELKAD